MRPRFVTVIPLVATFTWAATLTGAPKPDEKAPAPAAAPAETVYAFRQFVMLVAHNVDRLSEMVDVARAKQVEAMGLTPADQVAVTFSPVDGRGYAVDVRLDPAAFPSPQRRADELATKVLESVETQLREDLIEESGLPRVEDVVRRAEHDVEQVRREIRRTEEEIRGMTGRADASVEAIRGSVPKLDDERQAMKLKVVGAQARQKALAEAIDRLAKAAGERAKDDPVATELEKVVKGRELTVERLRKLQADNSVSAHDIDEAEMTAAEARARMLERREVVKQANGGELLAGLNRELAMLSIDIAEAEARLDATQRLLAGYVKVQDQLAQSDDLRRQRARSEDALEKARQNLSKARASIPDRVLRVTRSGARTVEDEARQNVPAAEGSAPAGSPAKP